VWGLEKGLGLRGADHERGGRAEGDGGGAALRLVRAGLYGSTLYRGGVESKLPTLGNPVFEPPLQPPPLQPRKLSYSTLF
jgi:hypothetical protein